MKEESCQMDLYEPGIRLFGPMRRDQGHVDIQLGSQYVVTMYVNLEGDAEITDVNQIDLSAYLK